MKSICCADTHNWRVFTHLAFFSSTELYKKVILIKKLYYSSIIGVVNKLKKMLTNVLQNRLWISG